MSDTSTYAAGPSGQPARQPAWLAARLIRLRHSRGRMLYAMLAAVLTGLVMNGPLSVVFGMLWFLAEGFGAPTEAVRPAMVWLGFSAIVSMIYAVIWGATMLFALPFRGLTEWIATLVLLEATLKTYAPGFVAAVPNWGFLLVAIYFGLKLALHKSGLAYHPLPWLTRHHRTRFCLPLAPTEAWERLRARPGKPHWDTGWAKIASVTPGDDSLLRVEVRRRSVTMPLYLRYTREVPGYSLTTAIATRLDDLAKMRPGTEALYFSARGSAGTLVEVRTTESHCLATLCGAPMEDRIADYWAHAAAQISGRPDGTFVAALLRPAHPLPPAPV